MEPKISTSEIGGVFNELVLNFKATKTVNPLWICVNESNFGFRQSFVKEYLDQTFAEWTFNLQKGNVVITPLVFYDCSSTEEKYSHYNSLISYVDSTGSIQIERYEPDDSTTQGKLNERLRDLFRMTFKKYTNTDVVFSLVAPKGLQNANQDRTLCGHHILYWTIFRLKYGLSAALLMLSNSNALNRFKTFCSCITDMRIGKCLGG